MGRTKIHHATAHGPKRAAEYASTGDALDAIQRGFRALLNGDPLPPEAVAWVESCERVKARIPKVENGGGNDGDR